jgi:putative FmdB family regulatory protein
MPTYGYRCPGCGAEFDVWQRMSDPAGASCPECGQAARRVFFAPAIVFNGSGFYKTDSRSASRKGTSSDKSAAPAKDKPTRTPPDVPAASSGATEASTPAAGPPATAGPSPD